MHKYIKLFKKLRKYKKIEWILNAGGFYSIPSTDMPSNLRVF